MFLRIYKIIHTIFDRFFCTPFWRITWKSSLSIGVHIVCDPQTSVVVKDSYIKDSSIVMKGANKVIIHSTLVSSKIYIKGQNNVVKIKNDNVLNGLNLQVIGNNCQVLIEKDTTINGAHLVCMGDGNIISIGSNCMLADGIEMWASDSHPIFMENNIASPINASKSILLADHVWIGQRACVLKGVSIGKNSIVGMASVVTNDVPQSSIVAGNPAKIIKSGVTWNCSHITI